MFAPRVLVRDSDLKLLGEIDDYQKVEIVPRFNITGAFILDVSASSGKIPYLSPETNPGGGLILLNEANDVIMSGPITSFSWSRSEDDGEGKVVVGGKDDMRVLDEHLVYPNPAVNIPSQGATAFYNVSGAADALETIMWDLVNLNAGPGALVARRVAHMGLQPDATRGTAPDFRYSFRFETVREALEIIARAVPTDLPSPIARGGLGFRVVQIPGNALEFQIYSTVDRVNTAKFSFELGNLTDAEYTVTAPSATNVILGAGRTAAFTDGPQVAANLVEYARTDAWFPQAYAEVFSDVGEIDPAASDASERLDTAADGVYDQGSGQVGLSITPVDTESLQYGRDWSVGDIVTAKVPYLTIQEQVREVKMVSEASTGTVSDAVIGTQDGVYQRRTPGVYRRITQLSKLMAKKETTV